jgi:uncharacterized Ntn-hydrolase superfamily protein
MTARACVAVLLAVFLFPTDAFATWSIVAVDPGTKQVGVGVASCVGERLDSVVSIVPGVAAGVAQGLLDPDSRKELHKQLHRGQTPKAAVRKAVAVADSPESVQIAAASLIAPSYAITGTGTDDWNGDRQEADITVQGNLLEGSDVLDDALKAYQEADDSPLADRLMLALAAGSAAGGDRRCNVDHVKQTSAAAAIFVANPTDDPWAPDDDGKYKGNEPFLALSVVDRKTRMNAVALLLNEYEDWRRTHINQQTEFKPVDIPEGSSKEDRVAETVGDLKRALFIKTFLSITGFVIVCGAAWWMFEKRRPRIDDDEDSG